MTTTTEIWKQVPLDFTFGETILASNLGNIKYNDKPIRKYTGPHGKSGYYSVCIVKNHTLYFHRLVFYAHSTLPLTILKQGRVIFKNKTGIVNEDGFYRNWYEDLLFEKNKIDFMALLDTVTVKEDTHPVYGLFRYGTWMPLKIPKNKSTKEYVEVPTYELILLDNNTYPILIRNITNDKLIKYQFNNSHDGYISITYNKKPLNYQISHIMLLTVFPHISRNDTVDHIDDNSLNHNIKNMQWLSRSENAIKGAKLAVSKDFKTTKRLQDEEWKPLQISEHTAKLYKISNMGRIQNTFQITLGNRLRGKKYRYIHIAISQGVYKRYYVHHLVYMTFHEPIPEGSIILHNDSAPLNDDGTYRNWAIDLRAGSKRENNIEYHTEKRNILYNNDTPEHTVTTPLDLTPAENTVIIPSENEQSINTVIVPDTEEADKDTVSILYWSANKVYSAYINGNINAYKTWCEKTQELSGPSWNTLWSEFIDTLASTTSDTAQITIITKFIRKLAKHRSYKQQKPNATLHSKRSTWTAISIMNAWKNNNMNEYKVYQEGYTGDLPSCPKWQARWTSFIDSLTKASNDTECKAIIKQFMDIQQRRASRLRVAKSKKSEESASITSSENVDDIQNDIIVPNSTCTPPVIVPSAYVYPVVALPPVVASTVSTPNIIQSSGLKQWKVKQIYEHFQENTLDAYKLWCETNHTLSSPEWDIQWYTFILELQGAPNRPTADDIIRRFIEELRKKRHDILVQKHNHEANPLERETRQQWPSISVLRAWKENKLNLFKEFQENYTGDSADCPKWQARWTHFTEAIQTAQNDEERKRVISKFMTAQRTRVYRIKCENK